MCVKQKKMNCLVPYKKKKMNRHLAAGKSRHTYLQSKLKKMCSSPPTPLKPLYVKSLANKLTYMRKFILVYTIENVFRSSHST